MVLRWFVFVCPSVHKSPRKSAVTLDSLAGPARNFQGLLNSLQVIFGWVTRTPGPRGQARTPKKFVLPNLSPPRVWGQGGSVTPFQNRDNEVNKTLRAEFWVLAHGPRKRGQIAGLARGQPKFWNFNIFHKRRPPKIRHWSLLVLCTFLVRCTPKAPGVPRGLGRVKIQSQNWDFL